MPTSAGLTSAAGKTSDWGVAPPRPRCYNGQASPLPPYRQWKSSAYSTQCEPLPPFKRCDGRRARAAGQIPSYSEWARHWPATVHSSETTEPLARYSATDSRRIITHEQLSLLSEEARLQTLLHELNEEVHRSSDDPELDRLAERQKEVARQLEIVQTRKERLAHRRNDQAGLLSTERKCELLPCSYSQRVRE